MKDQIINCPKCNTPISIDDVLTNQIADKIKSELEAGQKAKELEISNREKQLLEKQKQLESYENSIEINVADKLKLEKVKLKKEVEEVAKKETAYEIQLLTDRLKEKDAKIDEARKEELKLRQEKDKLEESKRDFEVQKQRELAEAKKEIEKIANKKAQEENQFVVAEYEKRITDATKANEDLKRKLQQGSQQNQGEVFELELETLLKTEFPYDEIIPVAKGVKGADVIQKVNSPTGKHCGIIIWEAKRTKGWNDGWIQKIKENQREAHAEIAVIVSVALPDGIKTHKQKDNVWVSNFESVVGLAMALRINLIQVMSVKLASVGKNEKMEIVYSYLTGTEFKQRVEAIVEAFTGMREDLDKEEQAFTKIWAKRRKQINKVIENTYGMYGELEAIAGKALPQIKLLELATGEDVEVADGVAVA